MVKWKKPIPYSIMEKKKKKPAFPIWQSDSLDMSLNLKISSRAQIFLDDPFIYQCWSLQLLRSHEYPSPEILGRYFSLLQSHCSS